jgi:hypothetical protein
MQPFEQTGSQQRANLHPFLVVAGLFVSDKGGKKRKRTSPLEHVFHGTKPANLDDILRLGMDPTFRRDGADFFSIDPCFSIPYTEEWDDSLEETVPWRPGTQVRLLVFLIITLSPGRKLWREGDVIIEMNKVEYELPIAEVTVLLS